ncbi:MAG TPA: outer membrane beta-barrel protein [Kofleriaceae bacterium]|nr:outer membrane beta-barrel protein [Kofleriaceae bacterium]
MFKRAAIFIGLAVIATPDVAHGEDAPVWKGNGIAAVAGGGVTGFTDKAVRDVVSSDVGGAWDLRVTLGSRRAVALDVSYLGMGANVRGPGDAASGVLEGTTFEAAARYNFLAGETWRPYAFFGIGWQHYGIRGATFDLMDAGMRSHDNLLDLPVGAGLAYHHHSGLLLDVRATYRTTEYNGLVRDTPTAYAAMNTWQLSAGIGYEL